MAEEVKYIDLINNRGDITTLEDFIKLKAKPAIEVSPTDILDIQIDNIYVNKVAIYKLYTDEEKKNYSEASSQLLKLGTRIKFPLDKYNKQLIREESNFTIENVDFEAFVWDEITKIYSHPGYKPSLRDATFGSVEKIVPRITVWVWCKALGEPGEGVIFNLSPFIENLNTNVAQNGGNFSFNLPAITCLCDENDEWTLKKGTVEQFTNNNNDADFVSKNTLHETQSTGALKRRSFLFHNIISSNDVIFIQFEQLEMQQVADGTQGDVDSFYIDKQQLYNKVNTLTGQANTITKFNGNTSQKQANSYNTRIWDMIGLVDTNKVTSSYENSDITISITGRDLSKLLIEDGCYFFPLEFAGIDVFNVFKNQSKEQYGRSIERVHGKMQILNAFISRSIAFSLQFIISKLSNVEICSDSLFDAYPEEEKSYYHEEVDGGEETIQSTPDQSSNVNPTTLSEKGFEILKKEEGLVLYPYDDYDKTIPRKRLVSYDKKDLKGNATIGYGHLITIAEQKLYPVDKNISLSSADSIFKIDIGKHERHVTNSIKSPLTQSQFDACVIHSYNLGSLSTRLQQQINVDANDLTIRDTLNLYNKSADKNGALTVNDTLVVRREQEGNLYFSEPAAPTVTVIKRIVPQKVKAAGIWQIVKIVIDDTIKNRKLVDSSIATQQGSLLNFVNKTCQKPFVEFSMDTYGDKFILSARRPPFSHRSYQDLFIKTGLEINESDIISDDFQYDDNEVYSWYQLQPRGAFFGNSKQFQLAFLPAIYFREYAEIWGSRPLSVVSNYIDYPTGDTLDKLNKDVVDQARQDLKFLIETHAYLPFTRKGTITMRGDRRIKRGTVIYLNGTDEIFYVESVTQNFSIGDQVERTTTLQVSHGMVWAHYDKYFKIIDFGDRQTIKQDPAVGSKKVTNHSTSIYFDIDLAYIIETDEAAEKPEILNLKLTAPGLRKQLHNESIKTVADIKRLLKEDSTVTILLEGATDVLQTERYNKRLGSARAKHVKKRIIDEIVTEQALDKIQGDELRKTYSKRIKIISLGESKQVGDPTTLIGRAKNRRVIVYIERNELIKEQKNSVDNNYDINWKVDKDSFLFLLQRKQFCR